MTFSDPVVVKILPKSMSRKLAQEWFREIAPSLVSTRPSLVLDFSEVGDLDSAGVEVLLRCMEETMKRNGDVKFAAIPPNVSAILELTRVSRLFEIFEHTSDAVESYHRFPAHAFPDTTTRRSSQSQDTIPSLQAEAS